MSGPSHNGTLGTRSVRSAHPSAHAVAPGRPQSPGWERRYQASLDVPARRLVVHGSIDELSVEPFREDLLELVAVGGRAWVDLTDVDFFPSAAVGALVSGLRRAVVRGTLVEVLVSPGSVPQRVLAICGLAHRPV